jgi:formylglycine-generating enzyme required for sulfatase activity
LDNNPVDDTGNVRVLRGGSWGDDRDLARAAFRYSYHPNLRSYDVGFRVVVRLPPSQDH